MNKIDKNVFDLIADNHLKYDDFKNINIALDNHHPFKQLIGDELFEKKRNEKMLFILNNYPLILINAFGGIDRFVELPILDFKKKFIGDTGYIDNIKDRDMKEPIMIGMDNFLKRPFIALKTEVEDDVEVNILFQRYYDSQGYWLIAKTSKWVKYPLFPEGGYLLNNFENIHNYSLENIGRLINNMGYIIYKDFLGTNLTLNASLLKN